MRDFSLSSISLIHFTLFISDNYTLFLKNTYSYQTLNYVFSVLKNVIKTCYQTLFFFHYKYSKDAFLVYFLNHSFYVILKTKTTILLPNGPSLFQSLGVEIWVQGSFLSLPHDLSQFPLLANYGSKFRSCVCMCVCVCVCVCVFFFFFFNFFLLQSFFNLVPVVKKVSHM